MDVRLLSWKDLGQLDDIHSKFYENEFPFPLESNNGRSFLDNYVVEDNGELITYGALEKTIEIIVITNKDLEVGKRREGLYKLFEALQFNAKNRGFNMIHCTVQDEKWERHLKKIGFKECKGKYLYYKI